MGTSSAPAKLGDLRGQLADLSPGEAQRLRRALDRVHAIREPELRQARLDDIAAQVAKAHERLAQRSARLPKVSYPPNLPVSQKKDDLLAAIRDHQVVIVAGETGSGKTTQLPKICLDLGRGVRGLIGHTQPRRIAARTVAERIADELGSTLGEAVGYKVRFTDKIGENTFVKVMTDGILLAEISGDRLLSRYDTLIIDEAHERSLNIDFILGYLKQLLAKRPDLKVVITSATIDTDRFARHFDGAPVVEVSGRTYPVEVRYRPVIEDGGDGDRDQTQAICDAVHELGAEQPGDILVFLSGEREIRDTADALRRLELRDTEILPLYARLSVAEQHKVFQPHTGRRVVLATNVAETSLTVPGIRYVVDPGTARISRYSHRLKVQRLPIEAISKASARQRTGRCGRLAEGICIRLYSEEDFDSRPDFTDPEILRTSLASVILQMTAIGLGDIAAFPFIEPPDGRSVTAGVQLLDELGAFEVADTRASRRLSPLGRQLAQLPLDPRLARMVIEAEANGCLAEVVVIAAALSIQDPRERPADAQQAADEQHARFADPTSDFLAYLGLWDYLREQQRERSGNQFRKMCRAEFLNYLRVREWQDLAGQLRQVAKTLGFSINSTPAGAEVIHRALLAGLLSHVGLKDGSKQEYAGARGARFALSPGSVLARKPPACVMVAELVETSRLWGRIGARIEPEWAEQLAPHLVKRTYSEPHWDSKRAAVTAFERVTLYGIPLVTARKVTYSRIDPELCRDLFIRNALVEGDWRTHHRFFHDNRAMLAEVAELENRVRRRDILVDDDTLYDFYAERVPAHVVSGRHFDSWWKKARKETPDLLSFSASLVVNDGARDIDAMNYPDAWRQGDLTLPITYQFTPGADTDGVTVHIPIAVLNQVDEQGFDWQIPGLRLELVTRLIKSLPKQLRRLVVPAPDCAREALARLEPHEAADHEPLVDALARELYDLRGVDVPRDAWQVGQVPDHLRVTFRVLDSDGHALAEGKELGALKQRLAAQLRATVATAAKAAGTIERHGLQSWTFGTLPRTFTTEQSGQQVVGYPSLVDEGATVSVRVLASAAEQQNAMWLGTRRLLLLNVPSPATALVASLSNETKLSLVDSPHGTARALLDDCMACAIDAIVEQAGGPAWDEKAFRELTDATRAALPEELTDVMATVARILSAARVVDKKLRGTNALALLPALADIRGQLSGLVYAGFVASTGRRRLPDLVRYLQAVERRLDKLPEDPHRDAARMREVARVQQMVDKVPASDGARELRWMLEELRVSYFAQTLGTAYPVSEQRVLRAVADLTP